MRKRQTQNPKLRIAMLAAFALLPFDVGVAMPPRAERGLCCATDRRFAGDRALGCRARADAGPTKRDPLQLPLRFHGELFGRAEGWKRSDAMSERQCREALLRLPAGYEGGHAGAGRQATSSTCHSGACGSGARRFATSPSAGSARRCYTAGSASCCCSCSRRGETCGSSCIDAARCAGAAGSS